MGAREFIDFAGARHLTALGGEGLLNSETMSVGPWLLVCLLGAGAAVCSIAVASWLIALSGVGLLIVSACWASCAIEGLVS